MSIRILCGLFSIPLFKETGYSVLPAWQGFKSHFCQFALIKPGIFRTCCLAQTIFCCTHRDNLC